MKNNNRLQIHFTKQWSFNVAGHSCSQIFVELKGLTDYKGVVFYKQSSIKVRYEGCMALCRADHKCLSLKYDQQDELCYLYDIVPNHDEKKKKKFSDQGFRNLIIQCGKYFYLFLTW